MLDNKLLNDLNLENLNIKDLTLFLMILNDLEITLQTEEIEVL